MAGVFHRCSMSINKEHNTDNVCRRNFIIKYQQCCIDFTFSLVIFNVIKVGKRDNMTAMPFETEFGAICDYPYYHTEIEACYIFVVAISLLLDCIISWKIK